MLQDVDGFQRRCIGDVLGQTLHIRPVCNDRLLVEQGGDCDLGIRDRLNLLAEIRLLSGIEFDLRLIEQGVDLGVVVSPVIGLS